MNPCMQFLYRRSQSKQRAGMDSPRPPRFSVPIPNHDRKFRPTCWFLGRSSQTDDMDEKRVGRAHLSPRWVNRFASRSDVGNSMSFWIETVSIRVIRDQQIPNFGSAFRGVLQAVPRMRHHAAWQALSHFRPRVGDRAYKARRMAPCRWRSAARRLPVRPSRPSQPRARRPEHDFFPLPRNLGGGCGVVATRANAPATNVPARTHRAP